MRNQNPLREAVLSGTAELVEALCRDRPGLIDQPSASGLPALDLALGKQDTRMVVALVNAGATSTSWQPSPLLIVEYLREISSWVSAGWLRGIEYETYRLVQGRPRTDFWSEEAKNWPTDIDIANLRTLSMTYGSWALDGEVVALATWQPKYEAWAAGR